MNMTYDTFYFASVKVARAILENPADKTKVYLIYANVTYEDILLKVKCLSPADSYESGNKCCVFIDSFQTLNIM